VERVNERRANELVSLVERELGRLAGARVSVLGLAFKPDTDDVRKSPAFPVVERLLGAGAEVRVYDPVATDAFLGELGRRAPEPVGTLAEALDADAVVIVTRWSEFGQIPALLAGRSSPPLVVDGRRMLDRDAVERYAGIGLGRRLTRAADTGR
jgi:UDPglucose 6-dehydrogenase/GDP-mannose 6-dehydrogenase